MFFTVLSAFVWILKCIFEKICYLGTIFEFDLSVSVAGLVTNFCLLNILIIYDKKFGPIFFI